MKQLLQLIIMMMIFTACNECQYGDEPIMDLHFSYDYGKSEGDYNPPDYDYVNFLGSDSVIAFSYELAYPLSIVSDTTTLVFSGGDQRDTLSIKYKRNFNFQSKECGYTVTLSDFQTLKETTFDSVSFQIIEGSQSIYHDSKNQYFINIIN
ncbi:DUF6452 family protein [Flammeovirga aprica]|uniref:Lipoprotein n=1 Tax=Flammeovirga aprica JL-4 TaxID=694437 RepID=A0A7X9S1E8_9BACT|nr:DUF6452 family protein [Flammeovirga aprica]NME72593.1 hypothetical protein [Flammeovirga aprica JL-4]